MQTCKLKDIPLPINRALENRKVFTQALFTRPESLAELLPYDEFIEKGKIFQLKDGSLGAIFEAELLEHEPMTEKEILRIVGSLKPWFSLPENCTLQILYDQTQVSKFDEEIKKIESSFPNPHPVSKIVFDEKIKALKDSCGTNEEITPLKRRTYLSIRYFPAIKNTTKAKDYLKRGEVVLYRQLQGFVSEFRSFQQILKNLKIGSEIGLRQLDASELLDFLRKFFNPKTYYKRTFAPFNKRQPISDQFLYNSPILDFPGIEREGVKTRTLSLKTSPLYAYPGGMAYFVELNFPFKLSLNFSFPSKARVKRFFDIKEFFLQNTPTARGKVQQEEIAEIQDRLAREDRCLQLTFNIIVEGKSDEELDDRIHGFRMLLLEKRAELVGDVNYIENEALRKSRGEAAGDLSSMPIHMADLGTDNFEQEFSLGLMDGERKILSEITAALKRIDDGRFGICQGTGQPISKARLRANPWARYCIKYATMVEQGLVVEGEKVYGEEAEEGHGLANETGEYEIVDEPDEIPQHDLEDTNYGALDAHDDE